MADLERRLQTLEADANRGKKSLEVRFVAGELTDAHKAEHAAIRATGVELMVVHLVGLTPRNKAPVGVGHV